MKKLRREMGDYYNSMRHERIADNARYVRRRDCIFAAMDAFAAANPDIHPCLLKARLHEEIANQCQPVIFRHSPFFFEMGVRPAESWGTPNQWSAASWMLQRRRCRADDMKSMRWINHFRAYNSNSPVKLWNIWSAFDYDHHCLGYTKLLETGVNGVIAEIVERRETTVVADGSAFLEAAERGCRALLAVAARFAALAGEMQATENDPVARRHLARIAEAAAWVPANPPRNFHEGLAALWFLREATASLEGIGISVVGHLDRLLINLYRTDLRNGLLTEDEAVDLLARWMLPTDVKFHVNDNVWPETSTCMELGGCDAEGKPVYNELTRLILETHRRERLLSPKPNCRIGGDVPEAFLRQIAAATLAGHNNFALLNDDVLIPACVRAGKSLEEARLYVNGGCQETMAEGVEHSAGAYYYFNLARAFDLTLSPFESRPEHHSLPEAESHLPKPMGVPETFDELYEEVFGKICAMIRLGADWAREPGRLTPEIQPSPLFSASTVDCVARGRDYTAGGARYNPSGIALVGFGTVVDSLVAIREAVFEDKWLEFDELRAALTVNWEGCGEIRSKLVALPKFGENNPAADEVAKRLAADLARFVRGLENERGDRFQASMFVYYMFLRMGKHVRATPDGRRDGDMLSQGVAPGRVRPPRILTDVFHSIANIDFADFPGNAVLDLQLPTGGELKPEKLAAAIRAFAKMGGPTLQLNCVSPETLREAQACPEKHQDLIVRISGLSAIFVVLDKEVQEEIINRAMMTA